MQTVRIEFKAADGDDAARVLRGLAAEFARGSVGNAAVLRDRERREVGLALVVGGGKGNGGGNGTRGTDGTDGTNGTNGECEIAERQVG